MPPPPLPLISYLTSLRSRWFWSCAWESPESRKPVSYSSPSVSLTSRVLSFVLKVTSSICPLLDLLR